MRGDAGAERFLAVNGLRIHYLEWGSSGRQSLVLLHGIVLWGNSTGGRVAHSTASCRPIINRFLQR